MFVQSPTRTSNGSVTTTQQVSMHLGGPTDPRYGSVELALANAGVGSGLVTVPKGITLRGLMQNGVIGYRRYRNTPYQASYCNYKSEGHVSLALRFNSTRFQAEQFPVAFGSNHSSGIGVADNLPDIDPFGGRLTVAAIASRALLLNTKNRAIAEARIKALRKQMDVAESLTGLASTVFMFVDPVIRVLQAWMAARKGNWRRAEKILGGVQPINFNRPKPPRKGSFASDVANGWLQYQYGWLPLINDIYDAFNLIKGMFANADRAYQFSVVRRVQTELVVTPTTTNTARFPTWESSSEARGSVEVKLRFRVEDAFAHFLNGLSLLNPAYVLWVGMPFSFVVDWILPVGTMLEALTATIGLTFVSGYCTTRTWGVQSIVATSANPLYGLPKAGQSGRATARALRCYMRREVFLSSPGFAPYIRFPFSSTERVASASALISQSRRMR